MERKLKIIQLISSSKVSGAERHVHILSRQLHNAGHDVRVVCPPGWLVGEITKEGVEVIESTMRGKQWLSTVRFLVREIWGKRVDVIQTHLTRPAYLCAAVQWFAKVPLVVTVHIKNDDPIYRKVAKGNNRVVVVSNYLKKELTALGTDADHLVTIYNGTDLVAMPIGDISAKRKEIGLSDDDLVVCHLGRVCVEKGHRDLLEAFIGVASHVPQARLVLAGRVEPSFKEELDVFMAKSELKGKVFALGSREDVKDILDASDICTLPSHQEAFPYAAIEAMARSKPVVVTGVGGLPEVVRDNENGIIVKDTKELEQAFIKLMLDADLRERLGKAGKKLIAAEFTLDHMVEHLIKLYSQLIKA